MRVCHSATRPSAFSCGAQNASTRPGYDRGFLGRGTGVGVLQRFERRLEGLVEGVFARAFGGVVQPVEVAAALQREAADRKAIVGQGRVLVPNTYVVELARSDSERLNEYDAALRKELGAMVTEHAQEQGWSFVGPVEVTLQPVDDLTTGLFRVRSAVVAGAVAAPPADPSSSRRMEFVSGTHAGQVCALTGPVTLLGRGEEADVRLTDLGVSRRHAEIRVEEPHVYLADLGSSNGTTVNGRPIDRAALHDGDLLCLGGVELVYRSAT